MRILYVSYPVAIATTLLSASTFAGAAPRDDTDGDGKLSMAEFQAAAQKRLMSANTDSSGTISLQEWLARPARAKATKAPTQRFRRLDANRDGQLDAAEIEQITKRRFAALDKNADGLITDDERPARNSTKTDSPNDAAAAPKTEQ